MSKEEKLKVLILGESNVGKNSIVTRFVYNNFDYNKYTISGAYQVHKTIFFKDLNKIINFEIWDTPGQKKYRVLHRVLFNNANVFILVYDITNLSSFEEIKNYWMNEIKLRAPKNNCKLFIFNFNNICSNCNCWK